MIRFQIIEYQLSQVSNTVMSELSSKNTHKAMVSQWCGVIVDMESINFFTQRQTYLTTQVCPN